MGKIFVGHSEATMLCRISNYRISDLKMCHEERAYVLCLQHKASLCCLLRILKALLRDRLRKLKGVRVTQAGSGECADQYTFLSLAFNFPKNWGCGERQVRTAWFRLPCVLLLVGRVGMLKCGKGNRNYSLWLEMLKVYLRSWLGMGYGPDLQIRSECNVAPSSNFWSAS